MVQPWDGTGHLARFTQPDDAPSTHSFTWSATSISWESRGADGRVIGSYAYSGSDVPRPGDERVRLNLWLFGGNPPTSGQAVDVLVRRFSITPPG